MLFSFVSGTCSLYIKNELQCLCDVYRRPSIFRSFNINATRALEIPGLCGGYEISENLVALFSPSSPSHLPIMNLAARFGHRLSNALSSSSRPIFPRLVQQFSSLPAKDNDEEEEVYDQRKLPADYDPATFDTTEHRSPPTDRVFCLVDEVSSLTLLEVAELSDIIMAKLGMKEKPVIAVMKAGTTAPSMAAVKGVGAAVEEKKTVFEVRLDGYDAAAKIKIIKEVRSFTELGLKEAKDLVEKTPTVIKKGVSKEEGEQIVEKLKALGAKVAME
ncbi:50S ribosomal protein L7/L12 [Nymphaea thermarum]|nr:50S ribosomal protein L7/L12 [Nymphaea thermarum]